MRVAAVVLYTLGLLAEVYVLIFLIRVVGKVRRVRREDRSFVIDGGDSSGNVEGPHLGTTLETFAGALDQRNDVIIALALGIVLGTAGNFFSLFS